MHVLITGAAGFLGRGIVLPFEEHGATLRLMDVVPFDTHHEYIQGSVEDLELCEKAVQGIDALVIAHMAPRGDKGVNYQTPTMPYDVNVKGTANLFHAAANAGIKDVVVITSQASVHGHQKDESVSHYPHDLAIRPRGIYSVTKAMQEVIGKSYVEEFGMNVSCLRVGYILDGERNMDKYGRTIAERNFADTDRRDIGEVSRLCLEKQKDGFETFHVMSTQDSMESWDVKYTCERLGWKPAHDFSWLPLPGEAVAAG